ncbi:hypothetical protein DR54_153 [Burkholderia pseudomallei HBPUB10303a]|nr:hypothetical protein DR54_153 [Burkholderia pseudomallei HBPUB10303a]CAJ6919530.1 Uncharacterised protein [Burkholderia pseudomallei]CAJ7411592.1 Uncharacterised protein [Burkholderia pseudomallei]CAJ9893102.1 Uncharacterised protein [Burkholderia pseudomallei]VBL03087.1 Uncharacterised protein [Burkholderia pseudomallei]
MRQLNETVAENRPSAGVFAAKPIILRANPGPDAGFAPDAGQPRFHRGAGRTQRSRRSKTASRVPERRRRTAGFVARPRTRLPSWTAARERPDVMYSAAAMIARDCDRSGTAPGAGAAPMRQSVAAKVFCQRGENATETANAAAGRADSASSRVASRRPVPSRLALPCLATPCRAMPCHAVPCRVTSSCAARRARPRRFSHRFPRPGPARPARRDARRTRSIARAARAARARRDSQVRRARA